MSSVDSLREFVKERLTAAAEEIFGVFARTIVEYEEEINRQRRLLDIIGKREINIHRIELPQQHVCKEKEDLADQQLCIQERNSRLDQEDLEPPRIKEEQEELWTTQEGIQLVVKQETPTYEGSEHIEDQTMCLNPDDTLSAAETQSAVIIPDIISVYNATSDNLFLSGDQEEPEQQERPSKTRIDTNSVSNPNLSGVNFDTDQGKKFKCDTCGKKFVHNSQLQKHQRIHTGERQYICNTCGRDFQFNSALEIHMRTHTGEKPFTCEICGRVFSQSSYLTTHVRTHTGEKPYICKTCGKRFADRSACKRHMIIHTGEKPFPCEICGIVFRQSCTLTVHMRTHTGEKPFVCNTCPKRFADRSTCNRHMRTHTGEKPYVCSTCGRRFADSSVLKRHMLTHTGEKPFTLSEHFQT